MFRSMETQGPAAGGMDAKSHFQKKDTWNNTTLKEAQICFRDENAGSFHIDAIHLN